MIVESNVPLQPYNSFGIVARAQHLARIAGEADLVALRADPAWRDAPRFVLGGGSNIVLTGDVKPLVLKIEIKGLRLVEETPRAWIVEAGAGENWHDAVEWMVRSGIWVPDTVHCPVTSGPPVVGGGCVECSLNEYPVVSNWPLPDSETPKLTRSVPAGTAGSVAVTFDQAVLAGRAWTSVQYCQPAAVCRNRVIDCWAAVDR